MQEKQREFETERRKHLNTILELKGNIRVFCRVRPLLGGEIEKFGRDMKHLVVAGENAVDVVKSAGSLEIEIVLTGATVAQLIDST